MQSRIVKAQLPLCASESAEVLSDFIFWLVLCNIP